MSLKIINVIIFGAEKKIALKTSRNNFDSEYYEIEQNYFEITERWENTADEIEADIIIFFKNEQFLQRTKANDKILFIIKNDWKEENEILIGDKIFEHYIRNSLNKYSNSNKISVYTATFNTKDKIKVAYESLINQTHQNWEWSIYDDSTDETTWEIIKKLAKQDSRILINKNNNQSKFSKIGHNKFNAAVNCNSEYLIELDHDDAFTNDALEKILLTHKKFPECGFIYGDWTEMLFESKQELDYGDGFAWGYGSYYYKKHPFLDREVKVCCAPSVNPLTIRRLWSMYNHPKSWKKNLYMQIGGHNKVLNCADDYELMLKTFLETKILHLHHYCYLQYSYQNNTKVSSAGLGWAYHGDIFRHVKYIEKFYNKKIKNRFNELGLEDWVYGKETTDYLIDFKNGKEIIRKGEAEQKANLDFKI